MYFWYYNFENEKFKVIYSYIIQYQDGLVIGENNNKFNIVRPKRQDQYVELDMTEGKKDVKKIEIEAVKPCLTHGPTITT